MTLCAETFLQLLSDAIGTGQRAGLPLLSEEDWRGVFSLAEQHHVLPLIVDEVYRRGLSALPSSFRPFLRRAMRIVSMQTSRTAAFLDLYRHLSEQGLEPIVMKGLICRELYPNPDFRFSADEDLLIRPGEAAACHRALTAYGLTTERAEKEISRSYETGYASADGLLSLEIHRTPFPPESAAYGEYNRFFTKAYESASTVSVDGTLLRTFSPTDHLLYLICHAMKHFLHGGFGIRQVCDICLFARKHEEEIDWGRLTACLKEIRGTEFAAALFAIGEKYLQIAAPRENGEQPLPAAEADPENLLSDILESGVYGASTLSRKHSSGITLEAVEKEKENSTGKASWRRLFFPPAAELRERYPYLKKHPYLLPAAWVQRAFRYLGSRSRTDNSAAQALKIGRERTQLLREYGLVGGAKDKGGAAPAEAETAEQRIVDTGAYISSLVELVRDGHEVSLPVVGSSMVPFLGDGRDRVFLQKPEGRLEKGDVVLYQRDNGDYVLHRICRVRKRDGTELFDLVGDAQTRIEPGIRREQICAKTARIERKGKIREPGSFYWWIFQHIWVNILPMRRPILKVYATIRRRR